MLLGPRGHLHGCELSCVQLLQSQRDRWTDGEDRETERWNWEEGYVCVVGKCRDRKDEEEEEEKRGGEVREKEKKRGT